MRERGRGGESGSGSYLQGNHGSDFVQHGDVQTSDRCPLLCCIIVACRSASCCGYGRMTCVLLSLSRCWYNLIADWNVHCPHLQLPCKGQGSAISMHHGQKRWMTVFASGRSKRLQSSNLRKAARNHAKKIDAISALL